MAYNSKHTGSQIDDAVDLTQVNKTDIATLNSEMTSAKTNIEENKTEISSLKLKTSTLDENLAKEINDRKNADDTLQSRIDDEISNRTRVDTELQTDVSRVSQDLTSHTSDTSNPHQVTKEQVGLGSVNNTSDLDKPISTATQTALDNKVSKTGDESISGTKTFTGVIKANEIDNTSGNAMVRYKSTENKVVLGGSTIPTTIMGSEDRPRYSKDGSDFEGKDIALIEDVESIVDSKITQVLEEAY